MNLLIDLGNSRSKWALETRGVLVRNGVCARADLSDLLGNLSEIMTGLSDDKAIERVMLASVLDASRNAVAVESLASHLGLRVEFARVEKERDGLRVAYKNVSNLGVDRWLAMLAAWSIERSAFTVIDAGSALTVDVVDGAGQHQGGFIVPGLRMMQEALFSRTAAVKVPQLSLPPRWQLGKDTLDCVENGVSAMLRGMLSQLLAGPARDSRIIFSGGDAEELRKLLNLDAEIRPNLVLEGLVCLL